MTTAVARRKKTFLKTAGLILMVGALGATLVAQTAAATRYDNQIQTTLTKKLAAKDQFRAVRSSVDDGIVTLTGTVDLYQRKLDAARLARKAANVQGVRNLITVAAPNVPDVQLEQKLNQRAFEFCAPVRVKQKTAPGKFCAACEIHQFQTFAKFNVRFGFEIMGGFGAPGANFRIVLRAFANGHGFVRQIGQT